MARKKAATRSRRKKKVPPIEHSRVVTEHPLYDEIADFTRQRFSAKNIWLMLQFRYQEDIAAGRMLELPSVRSIERWRQTTSAPKDLLPLRKLTERLGSMQRQVAMFDQLQELYHAAEDRVVKLLAFEDNMPVPMPGTDKAIETLIRVGLNLWQVGQDLGAYPKPNSGGLTLGMQQGGDGKSSIVLQLGSGPPRVIDTRTMDMTTFSDDELKALAEMQDIVELPAEVKEVPSG